MMNKQIELYNAGTPNVRVYYAEQAYDCYTVVWPYKAGFSVLSQRGEICEHFTETNGPAHYPHPLDSQGYKHLGKRVKFEQLPDGVKKSILYLF